MNNKKKIKLKKESLLLTILKSINIYGMPFSIRYKNNNTYISALGIILSIISILSITSLFLYYFIELINHSNFTILSNNDKDIDYSINLSNIPMMLGLMDTNATLLELNQEYFSISAWRRTLIPINNSDGYVTLKRLELEYCNESIYQYEYPEMKKYDLSKYFCIKPNQNIEINGRYGDSINGFNNIDFFINLCITDECLNKTNNFKDIQNILYGSYFTFHYLYNIIDNYNYKNPFIQNFRSENLEIAPLSFKKFFYFFSSINYISNNGILFNEQKKYTSFIFDHLITDFVGINNSDSYIIYDNKEYLSMIQIVLSCADYSIIYNRTYKKLTDIFSQIGGLIDFIFIICNFITTYFSKKNLIVDISNNLVCNKCINSYIQYHNNNDSYNVYKFINKENIKKNDIISNNNDYVNSEIKIYSLNLNKFKSKINENKKYYEHKYSSTKNLNIIDNYLTNSKLKQFLNVNYCQLYPQKLKISFIHYIIPFFCLKKLKYYNVLNAYSNIINSYLSLEEILPSIERISRLYNEDKNNEIITNTKYNNVFSFSNN